MGEGWGGGSEYTFKRSSPVQFFFFFFCLPAEKASTLKGKNLLLVGANSFLLELTSFQKGVDAEVDTVGCLPC